MQIRALAATTLVSAFISVSAWAGPYSNVFVFGDSLSDNGNLAEILGPKTNFPNPPSYSDSFTNGPVANVLLAQSVGLTLTPSLWVTAFTDPSGNFGGANFQVGTNYAVAGATAASQAVGGPTGINLPQQVAAFGARTALSADGNALYVVEIGGNDVRNAARQGTGTAAAQAGAAQEIASIQTLLDEGARKLLVVNVPNVGVIPEFAQDNPTLAAAATQYSIDYDTALAAGLNTLTRPTGTSITLFDLYSFNTNLLANAASYGFTNTTDRCYTSTPYSAATSPQCGTNAANINSFVYWDAIHPTARVQALWASGYEQALGVPEPASFALLGAGLLGLMAARRRA